MIVSQFCLPVRWVLKSPSYAFEVMVTNLEAAELRFRFRFVATQPLDGSECTQTLRDHVEPLGNQKSGLASLLARQPWTRNGSLYSTRWDFPIGPGETQRTGLATRTPLNIPGLFTPDVFEPEGALRGHWELSLPAIAASVGAAPQPQRSSSARVLIAAWHRVHQSDGDGGYVHEGSWPLPLGSGQAEHLLPPDPISRSRAIAGTRSARRGPKRRAE